VGKIICAVDLETTGLDSKKDEVTEIGAILWDTELNAPIKFFNRLLKINNGPVPEFIVKLTGITDNLLEKYGEYSDYVFHDFQTFANNADFMLAHNAPFDRKFLEESCQDAADWKWIDSCTDVDYPEEISTRKLTHLAAEHKIVNPFAHRAVTDVLTMLAVVSQYDWSQTIKNSQTPNVTLKAMVTYGQNEKAKGNGYRWNAETKSWIKNVKEHKVEAEIAKCRDVGFLVKRIG
jgi:DNA polymerase-3 subunit epsilon